MFVTNIYANIFTISSAAGSKFYYFFPLFRWMGRIAVKNNQLSNNDTFSRMLTAVKNALSQQKHFINEKAMKFIANLCFNIV